MQSYAERLSHSFPLREPVIRSVIKSLRLTPGSRGLDVGCGIGDITRLLAGAVGPAGHVTGLDHSSELIAAARGSAQEAALAHRVSFQQGDMNELPFRNGVFDWAWSADCVGYAPIEPLQPLRELLRVIKPGGWIAILAWSSQQLLPGFPLLEARLNATPQGIAPFSAGNKPEEHFLRALGWFRQLGVENVITRTFAGTAAAPLEENIRKALVYLLQMRWPGVDSSLSQTDLAQYRRLCQPESADFILDHPDYCAFFTYSLFYARLPE